MGHGDVEWLDDDGQPARPDEELPGRDRRPISRRTKIGFGIVAAVALGGVVTAGVVLGPDDPTPRALPTPAGSASSAVDPPLPDNGHRGPPAAALSAIRAAFPGATLQSFVSVAGKTAAMRPTLFYNLTLGGRMVTVRVTPLRRTDTDLVSRNATSVELGQQLGTAFVDVKVAAGTQRPRATDFDAMQNLVQDTRLLAQK